jgi:type II secretory pathway component PulF
MTADDLIALNDEIAAMARAGLPLDQGLAALARDMGRGQLRTVTTQLAADLRAGQSLPEALQRQGSRVPPFYASLVEAGVRSGRVAEVLATLTEYARAMAGLRTTIVDAILYPAVVLLFAAAILAALIGYLVPQYGEVYHQFGMTLPALTEAVLVICRHADACVLAPLLVLLGALLLVWAALAGTERGRSFWTQAVYSLPIIGSLIRAARLAAFAELLAILVDYELPLPRAFHLAGAASSDPFLAAGARRAEQDLKEGLPLSPSLREHLHLPELIAWMTAVGERRGELGRALHQVAELYRRQVERRAALLRTVLPPFLIVATAGVVVGLFVIALILPLVKLLEGLSKF